jgi:hypothetical protein
LIGGFSFSAVLVPQDNTTLAQDVLSFFYYTCFAVALVCSLFILANATIVVMFGPTMALKGATDDAVKFAATHMRNQQFVILRAAWTAITALFIGACIISWAKYLIGIAVITTVVYVVGYYYLMIECYKAFRTFVPADEEAYIEPTMDGSAPVGSDGNKRYKLIGSDEKGEAKSSAAAANAAALLAAQEATKLKVKAYLWKRQSIEDGGLFVKYFAVLEKGRLDLYSREKDYRENANPINSKPIKLWQYDLELDHRKYAKNVTSLTSAVKSTFMGNEDFAMSDLLTSEHDLQYASRNFKFGLVPKISSELVATTVHEFLAHDEKCYKLWTESLGTVVRAFDEIAANPSVEHTIRVGTADVELVVQAANNQM